MLCFVVSACFSKYALRATKDLTSNERCAGQLASTWCESWLPGSCGYWFGMAAQRFWQTSCGLAIGHPWHWRATDLGEAWQGRLLQCICQAWERHGWVIKAKQDHGPPEGMSIAQAMVHGYVFWRPKACPHSLWTKVPWSNVFKLYLLCWCLFANCYPDPNQHFGFCLLAFECME